MGSGVRFWFALLVGLFGLAAAWAQTEEVLGPPVIQLGSNGGRVELGKQARFWLDERGDQTVDTIEAAGDALPWLSREPGQIDRLDGRVLWIRFDAVIRSRAPWFLQVGAASVDRAELFYRHAQGGWVRQEAGDNLPSTSWAVPGRVPTFALAADPERTVRYWLRVEHTRLDFAAPLVLAEQSALLAERDREQFLLGGYFGLAALIAAAALANGLAYSDRSFLAYAVYVVVLASGQLARLGIGGQHFWPGAAEWNEAAALMLPFLSAAAALWFVKVATEPARFSIALDLATWTLIAATLAAVGVDAVVASRSSMNLVLALAAGCIVAIAGLIALAWIRGKDPHAGLIALGFLPVLVTAVFPLARAFNLVPSSWITRYALLVGAMLEMPILYYALSVRMARRQGAQIRAAALSHTDALTGLAHRDALLQRLEQTLQRARAQKQTCALLAVRISNVPAIVSEFGEEVVAKTLVVAAAHLRRAATDIDLAARVGDNAFVLLVESPTTQQVALSRAQQIVASGLRQAEGLPGGLSLKFHVAVAMLPHEALDAEVSLQWAIDGLEGIAPDTRKLIKPLNF
jgi:diguanylate cyclase (GGDEF)-like protein